MRSSADRWSFHVRSGSGNKCYHPVNVLSARHQPAAHYLYPR